MRTTVGRARRAAAAAGLILVTGCSADTGHAPAPFDQKAVQTDLNEAIAAAGLPEGETTKGFPAPSRSSELAAELAPCVVSWSASGYPSPDARKDFNALLTVLGARGWREAQPSEEVPLAEGGSYVLATYKKQGWILNARHSSARNLTRSTALATDESCFDELTDDRRPNAPLSATAVP
ncbi:hypothetical protein [Streptomyces coelicoflavus]|uniref:DUF3558 domain-containing protein n=1 Tax=Streptomyces coelicoflavus TaxID=285562 RepID=A0A6N9UI23_9ACTN|nr:hypothetical protein [Streptomyces coelicoflavus]NEB15920.1 hypothetical protein [Streptomyces coelicoflavus]